VQWLNDLLLYYADPEHPHPRHFDRILIIRIFPFPTSKLNPAETNRGWIYEVLGPAKTVGNVRTASQADRNRSALEMLVRTAESKKPLGQPPDAEVTALVHNRDVVRSRARWSRAEAALEKVGAPEKQQAAQKAQRSEREEADLSRELVDRTEITWTTFVCLAEHAPLSWKLTAGQKAAIDSAWERITRNDSWTVAPGMTEPPLQTLDHFFSRVKRSP